MQVFFRDSGTGKYHDETPFLSHAELKQMEARVEADISGTEEILTVLEEDPSARTIGVPLFVIDIKDKFDAHTIQTFMESQIQKVH